LYEQIKQCMNNQYFSQQDMEMNKFNVANSVDFFVLACYWLRISKSRFVIRIN
jgi:hypothetical protein